MTYRHATAFESLVGYWQLNGQFDRMVWAFNKVDGLLQEDLRGEPIVGKMRGDELR